MSCCHVIVDSCCDLPFQIVDRNDVTLLKFSYAIDGGTFDDDLFQTVSSEDFYNAMRKGSMPTTSQLALPLLTDVFSQAAKSGVPTVYLSFSSGLSGSYDAAVLVREQILAQYPDFELYIVDTRLASVAEGLLVYEALSQQSKGMTAKELAAWALEARNYVVCMFMVEDLESLRRGGRIPSSIAVCGSALDVKPLLTIDIEGKLSLCGVSRGRKKGIRQLADFYQRNRESATGQMVMIGHADCPKDAGRLQEALVKIDQNALTLTSPIGPVIGSHVGPGMIAIVCWGQDKRENMSVSERIARRVKGKG